MGIPLAPDRAAADNGAQRHDESCPDAGQHQDLSEEKPLSDTELGIVYGAAEKLAKFVPCTGCRYCCAGCPKKLDIPNLINLYNDIIVYSNINPIARYGALPEDKRADACIGCGQCTRACPQKIDAPEVMKKLASEIASKPTWEQMCKEREAAAEAAKKR